MTSKIETGASAMRDLAWEVLNEKSEKEYESVLKRIYDDILEAAQDGRFSIYAAIENQITKKKVMGFLSTYGYIIKEFEAEENTLSKFGIFVDNLEISWS